MPYSHQARCKASDQRRSRFSDQPKGLLCRKPISRCKAPSPKSSTPQDIWSWPSPLGCPGGGDAAEAPIKGHAIAFERCPRRSARL